MNRQSWLSPIHFQVTNSSIWSISTELEVGITHENNISHLMFQHMAIASIPKQDSYNSSLITMLFTQQKTHMQFEPQFTKINTTFIKSGATRHMFGKKKHLWNVAAPQEGAFSWRCSFCQAADPHAKLCWRQQPTQTSSTGPFPLSQLLESL